jgi:hypothetical protein
MVVAKEQCESLFAYINPLHAKKAMVFSPQPRKFLLAARHAAAMMSRADMRG